MNDVGSLHRWRRHPVAQFARDRDISTGSDLQIGVNSTMITFPDGASSLIGSASITGPQSRVSKFLARSRRRQVHVNYRPSMRLGHGSNFCEAPVAR